LKCSECGEEINRCDQCDEEFKVGQEILCMSDPFVGGCHLHFCNSKCREEWLEDNFPPSTATVENEGESC